MIEFLYLFGEYSLAIYYTLFFQPFIPSGVIYLPLLIIMMYYHNTMNYISTGLLFAHAIKAGESLKFDETYAFVGNSITQFIGIKFDEKNTIVMPECMTVYEYIYFDFKNHFTCDLQDYSTTIIFLILSFSRGVLLKHVISSLIGLIILITIKYVQNYNNLKWYNPHYNQTVLFNEGSGKLLPYPVPIMVILSFVPEFYFKLNNTQKKEISFFERELTSTEVLFDDNENLDLSDSEPEFSESESNSSE